jgi:hypothetical protein
MISALVFSLSGSSAFAQSVARTADSRSVPMAQSRSFLDQANAAASRLVGSSAERQTADDYRPAGMSPSYFWTAIGLLGAGGAYLVSGAMAAGVDHDLCGIYDLDCGGADKTLVTLGAGLAGSGALVWMLGKKKAQAAGNPQIVTMPRGFAVRSRVSF